MINLITSDNICIFVFFSPIYLRMYSILEVSIVRYNQSKTILGTQDCLSSFNQSDIEQNKTKYNKTDV